MAAPLRPEPTARGGRMPSRRIALAPLLEQLHDAALGALPWELLVGPGAYD